MRPRHTTHDSCDRRLTYSVGDGELVCADPAAGVLPLHRTHLFIRQFGIAHPLASWRFSMPATLPSHVSQVVGLRTEEQMGWIDTPSDIATVTDTAMRRDRTNDRLVGETVCRDVALVDGEQAVAVPHNSPHPQPTIARLVNFRPESGKNLRRILSLHPVSFHVGATLPAVSAAREPSLSLNCTSGDPTGGVTSRQL